MHHSALITNTPCGLVWDDACEETCVSGRWYPFICDCKHCRSVTMCQILIFSRSYQKVRRRRHRRRPHSDTAPLAYLRTGRLSTKSVCVCVSAAGEQLWRWRRHVTKYDEEGNKMEMKLYVCVYICVYVQLYMCICMLTCTHIHGDLHICIHTHFYQAVYQKVKCLGWENCFCGLYNCPVWLETDNILTGAYQTPSAVSVLLMLLIQHLERRDDFFFWRRIFTTLPSTACEGRER